MIAPPDLFSRPFRFTSAGDMAAPPHLSSRAWTGQIETLVRRIDFWRTEPDHLVESTV